MNNSLKTRHTHWSEGWEVIQQVCIYRNWCIEIGYNPEREKPYCIAYGGAGHYFRSVDACRGYAAGRGWITTDEV